MDALRISSFEKLIISGNTYYSTNNYRLTLDNDIDYDSGMEQIKNFYVNTFDEIIKRCRETNSKCVSLNVNGYCGKFPWDN